ncbi:hypothetical protein [uncultured Rhodoblastus sp.]|uniref:Spy/CpxP family protein refolding chaperone n=1 Tax=uncultured Rhodoblastus sp. TaxID=543037 RepID=UPI0025DDB1B3|nr:hypothetical protein [uncultured Rhodoblastus sp.]
MKKLILLGLASVALAGFPSIGGSRAQTPAEQSQQQTGPADNQIANEVDARIARLKAYLNLTVDQEKNWPGLQSALHDYGVVRLKSALERGNRQSRREREQQRRDRPDDIALLRTMANGLAARGAALNKLADAAEPLFTSLDDRQKRELFQYLRTDYERRRG